MEEEKIEIRVLVMRGCVEINSRFEGREFTIQEIEIGAGKHRRTIKYTNGFLKYGAECNAVIVAPGKVNYIIN